MSRLRGNQVPAEGLEPQINADEWDELLDGERGHSQKVAKETKGDYEDLEGRGGIRAKQEGRRQEVKGRRQ